MNCPSPHNLLEHVRIARIVVQLMNDGAPVAATTITDVGKRPLGACRLRKDVGPVVRLARAHFAAMRLCSQSRRSRVTSAGSRTSSAFILYCGNAILSSLRLP